MKNLHNFRNIFSVNLSGISALALILGISHITTPVYATDTRYFTSFGRSLKDGGGDEHGASYNLSEHFDSDGNSTHQPVFVVWSTGGTDYAAPGWGGKINLNLEGNMAGYGLQRGLNFTATNQWGQSKNVNENRFANVTVAPLVFVYSQGGHGMDGWAANGMHLKTYRGEGERGQDVTVNLNASISTSGDNFAGVWASSAGGDAGNGNTSGNPYGGNGGPVRVNFYGSRNPSISTQGNNAPGLVAESVGAFAGIVQNVSVGGMHPSPGGDAYGVWVHASGSITTTGNESSAIIAQNLGGVGSLNHGNISNGDRSGGAGGNIHEVTEVLHSGTIHTYGTNSHGIAAYSVGGSGGSGVDYPSVNHSGSGGHSGDANWVKVVNAPEFSDSNGSHRGAGYIKTEGDGAAGILAASLGGGSGGGYFGFGGDAKGGDGHGVFHNNAGSGGNGGLAREVYAENTGTIITRGDGAPGVSGYSIGGIGGTGGDSTATGIFVAVALGGNGGTGGAAAKVTINESANGPGSGSIETTGESSPAIVAQSIGGGGGHGGSAKAISVGFVGSVSVAVGGSGGGGGGTGEVHANNSSRIKTTGGNSYGIQAQSIGGGGGAGGNAFSAAAAIGGGSIPAVSIAVSIGGSGGDGADGNKVFVNNYANITTLGANAHGIYAQSIGGGGGDGGSAVGWAASLARYAYGGAITVGGNGGGGGHGRDLFVTNTSHIETSGAGASGIFAQSIGGGGGSAGDATSRVDIYSLGKAVSGAVTVAVGGTGGGGGVGRPVDIRNSGSITTRGTFAPGIFAQSIGGGGGNGGKADTGAGTGLLFGDTISKWMKNLPLSDLAVVGVTIGGSGGNGGNGDVIYAENKGLIETYGSNSHGVFAQSIGGGGGDGGGYYSGDDGNQSIKVSVGGHGGGGGAAGKVTVNNYGGTIRTWADGSHGMFAQSVGGGGGTGGTLTAKKDDIPDIGGQFVDQIKDVIGYDKLNEWAEKNGLKNDYEIISKAAEIIDDTGGLDPVFNALKGSKFIKDYNELTKGLENESVKEYPSFSVDVAIGGSGGSGGGGGVSLQNDPQGHIATYGNLSYGMFAQSIGGGGGVAGTGASSSKSSSKFNANLTIGGSGDSAGNGGQVYVLNQSGITTHGDASYGIMAQSVGGGGGVGAGATSPETKKFTANLAIGGNGGKGGNGGSVEVVADGGSSIVTSGIESHAIVGQSIGGGGGVASVNLGEENEEEDNAALKESLETGDKIAKILGAAGAHVVGRINKEGAGGVGTEEDIKDKDDEVKDMLLEEASFTVNIGGRGGNGGSGGTVKISHSGHIETAGQAAFGILAQSIGGGGGLFSKTGEFDKNHGHAFSLGGKSGAQGNGGDVNVILYDTWETIKTSGDGATGILAQSIGGGGGYLGRVPESSSSKLLNNDRTSGNGGHVTINAWDNNAKASITTTGRGAHGIHAQSIGGGGGTWTNVDVYTVPRLEYDKRTDASGNGGKIDIQYRGSIHATGENSYAILAQSGKQDTGGAIDKDGNGGAINIRLDGGEFVGGAGDRSAAIRVDGGVKGAAIDDEGSRNNIIIEKDATVSALSGIAILGRSGSEFVTIHGKVIGGIDLAYNSDPNGHNKVRIENGGYYQSGNNNTVNLGFLNGNDNWFDIWQGGTVDIGGVNNITNLTINGAVNIKGGTLLVDVNATTDGKRSNDTLTVAMADRFVTAGSGIGGYIKPNVMQGLLPGNYRIFGVKPTESGHSVISNPASPISWKVTESGQSIAPVADFVGSASNQNIALNSTQQAMLGNLQSIWDDGTQSSLAPLFGAAANIESRQQYETAVTTLDPSKYAVAAAAQTTGAQVSLNAVQSCPVFVDAGVSLGETQCVWGRVSGSFAKKTGDRPTDGFKQNQFSYRIGAQFEVAQDWFFGITGAYSSSETNSNSGHMKSDGKGGDVSVALKRQMGPWLFSVSGHLGYGSFDTIHHITIAHHNGFTSANRDVWVGAARARAAYELTLGRFYVRPSLDLDVIHTYTPSFVSQGNFMFPIYFDAMKNWTLAGTPSVEVGTRIDIDEKTWLRPFASIGATFLSNPEMDTKVGFGMGTPKFTSTHKMEDRYLNVGAGLQFFSNDQIELRAEYNAKFAKDYVRHDAVGRMSIKF